MSAVAFIDTKAHPAAEGFYRMFPAEPTLPESPEGSITVGKIVKLPAMTLEGLLEGLVANVKKGGQALVVGHGTDAGMLIAIGSPKNGVYLETQALDAFRRNREGEASDKETAQILMMEPKALAQLKALIAKVQALELERIELRACATGSNAHTLSRLQVFFNAKRFCAPKIYDSFGPIPVGKVTKNAVVWAKWLKDHPDAIVEGETPDRFALDYKIDVRVALSVLAESEQAVKNWVARHLPGGNYSSGPFSYHAFTNLTALVFAGDPGFRANLAEAVKGKEPSKTIDIKALTD